MSNNPLTQKQNDVIYVRATYASVRNQIIDEIIKQCQIIETQPGYTVNMITEEGLRLLKTKE